MGCKEMDMKTFSGDWAFMSNFTPVKVSLDGNDYPSVEHAYQAAKTHVESERQAIRDEPKANKAKKMGRKLTTRRDWKEVRLMIMEDLQYQKYNHSAELRAQLLATGNAPIVEGNSWHDNFWGDCSCAKCEKEEGQNYLGRILMMVRDDLKSKE